MNREEIADWFQGLQDDICHHLEVGDGTGKFHEDLWKRPEGGGGRTRIIQGTHIEKGGVNFSAVHGPLPEKIGNALRLDAGEFFATGVSIVLHPKNPWVPIIHMNVRYFEMSDGKWWFGGGIDLTPHYVNEVEAKHFHQTLKTVCDQHHEAYYPVFKKWADDYFYVKHRKETRGIGGIFFDRLSGQEGFTKEQRFAFVQSVGEAFAPLYLRFLADNKERSFEPEHKKWQLLRRGRYVEFNLVWDKGTKFGLDTDGRIESILMSLPPEVNWDYNVKVADGSPEQYTLSLLRKGIDWI
ncbi:MAG: oxygen-dependent coproporphyrinogen oxidase [Saprospiraceae bacterium]|nr:oxygen-dependent coproporphyrinogen oxidase [Saprospiraceae bacterium]